MNINGVVREILPDNKCVAVDESKKSYTATIKGSIKKNKLYVGDKVSIEEKNGTYVINNILERENFFIRPPVSNIDFMVICTSIDSPKPDFMLLDKQIILCKKNKIVPIIVITKMDLLNEENNKLFEYISNVYSAVGIKVITISSKKNEVLTDKLKLEKNKIYAFSGASGVGKSTIISNITKDLSIETSEVSKKTNRGRHTTKYVKLYEISDSFIIDTPGFSSYDLIDVEYKELKSYYNEFSKVKCVYLDCNHVYENECKVKDTVKSGIIDESRYERYVKLYNDLKKKDELKYKR